MTNPLLLLKEVETLAEEVEVMPEEVGEGIRNEMVIKAKEHQAKTHHHKNNLLLLHP